jgi:hypothetical protein
MMEAARTSETLVNLYQTTWRYNPEDSHLHNKLYDPLETFWYILLLSNTWAASFEVINKLSARVNHLPEKRTEINVKLKNMVMINLVLNLTNQVGVSGYKLCIKIFLKCRD